MINGTDRTISFNSFNFFCFLKNNCYLKFFLADSYQKNSLAMANCKEYKTFIQLAKNRSDGVSDE